MCVPLQLQIQSIAAMTSSQQSHTVLYSDLEKATHSQLCEGLQWRLDDIITESTGLKSLLQKCSAGDVKRADLIKAIKDVDTILSDLQEAVTNLDIE